MTTVPYDIVNDVLLVIQTINLGYTPSVACDRVGLNYGTFTNYTKPGGKYPHLADMRQEAEDRLYNQTAEAPPRKSEPPIYGSTDPREAAVISGNIKWLLERRRQKAYGAHSVIEHQITADKEVLDALNKAKSRAQSGDQLVGQIIEG